MANKPFFVPRKEIDLFNSMNEELIDEIVGQNIDIYKVSLDESNANIYGEAEDGIKYFEKGFRVNCLILFNEPVNDMAEFGTDINADMEAYFLRSSLEDTDFYPETGDILDWNNFWWEVDAVTEPQLVAGHPEFNFQVKMTAHRTRLSNVNIEERAR
tara:strand:+ start:109 stop:579 length:471 start_codon:yes stop_codon:yes gene_type:complete